ncbi:MAG: diacylglycerol kinase family lipid kinase [Rhodospirillales bacterium]|nr:diacylglycerol kinase family lipid kinase [Rhodospirillales bacterium]
MVIVFNPTAGNRRVSRLWRVLDILAASGVRCEVARTAGPGEARLLAARAAASGERVVVAAGGDGTIAEVAAGLIGSDSALGVIPLGTANVLAREYALPFPPRAVAAALAFARTRPLWPGLAETDGGTERVFVQMLGLGFDAAVVRAVGPRLKRLTGRAAYAIETLATLFRYDFRPIRLRIDGIETEAASAIVTKGRLYGGPWCLAPEARSDAPGFSVVLFDRAGPRAALCAGIALPLGRLGRMGGVRRLRAREVEVIGVDPIPAQADGDPAGKMPRRVRDAAAGIPLVVG